MSTVTMRQACRCGGTSGYIQTKNGQDCVYCDSCSKHQYNAPKTETGRAARSIATTHKAIKPGQRWRIIARASSRCEICGARGDLHVAHIVSVEVGHNFGLTDDEINSDENLIAACPECNLGMGSQPIPIRLVIPILKYRAETRGMPQ